MPGLLTLKTDLKSLKYGQDTPGGGDSGQPYIKTDINTIDSGINQLRLTKFDDGLVRGGIIGATNASVVDTLRIGKFFADFPKGSLFLVKQTGLQLSNPQLEHINTLPTNLTGANLPISGQGFLNNIGNFFVNTATSVGAFITNTVNTIENKVGPTRIYNPLGTNTLAQIPLTAIGGHVLRHGFLPTNDPDKLYFNVVRKNNFLNNHNRLEGYAGSFNLGGMAVVGPSPIDPFSPELTSYIGGPDSVYGIGRTTIRKSQDAITNNQDKINQSLIFSQTKTSNSYPSQVLINNAAFSNATGSLSRTLSRFSIFNPSNQSIDYLQTYTVSIARFNTFISRQIANKRKQATSPSSTPTTPTPGTTSTGQGVTVSASTTIPLKKASEIKGDNTNRTWRTSDEMKEVLDRAYDRSTNIDLTTAGQGSQANTNQGITFTTSQLPGRFFGASNLDPDIAAVSRDGSIYDYTAVPYSNVQPALRKYSELQNRIASGSQNILFPVNHSRDSSLPAISSSNDFSKRNLGPSAHPDTDNSGLRSLSLLDSVYDYGGGTSSYSIVKQEVDSLPQQQSVSIDRGNTSYKYNTGAKLAFNRENDINVASDELALQFTPINPFSGAALTTLSFLAYITDYNDAFDSTWGDVKYVGRAEKFYIFNEFKRSISLGFNIPCYNSAKLTEQHKKLNTLVSILAGKYENNLLGGVITKLTAGNYVNDQPCIITTLNFSPIADSSWDLDKKLAFYIKATVNFTLIHDFLPQYGAKFINA